MISGQVWCEDCVGVPGKNWWDYFGLNHNERVKCSQCNGTGLITLNNCIHERSSNHFYCSHGKDFTSSAHNESLQSV